VSPAEGQRPDRRFLFLGLGVGLLAILVVVVALSGGSEEEDGATTTSFTAPAECVELWNSDPETVSFGAHNASGHGFSVVQVGYIAPDAEGGLSDDSDAGSCAVIFGSTQLSLERPSIGLIHPREAWKAFPFSVDSEVLEELQLEALELTNARLTPRGTLAAQ
jgi:hypothetical protein